MTSLKRRSLFESRWSSSPGRGLPSTSRVLVKRSPNTRDPNRYYHYLGVAPWATREEITKAYRRLSKKCHPDSPTPDVQEFHRLSTNYRLLVDEETREEYNSTPEGLLYVDDLVKEFIDLSEEPPDTGDLPEPSHEVGFFDYSSVGFEVGDREEAQEWYRLLSLALRFTTFRGSFKVCLVDPEDQTGFAERPPTFFVKRGLSQKEKIDLSWTLKQFAGSSCVP